MYDLNPVTIPKAESSEVAADANPPGKLATTMRSFSAFPTAQLREGVGDQATPLTFMLRFAIVPTELFEDWPNRQ